MLSEEEIKKIVDTVGGKSQKIVKEALEDMRKYIDEKIDYDVKYWKRQLNEKYADYEDNVMAITITKLLCGSAIGITGLIVLGVLVTKAIQGV